MCLSIPPSRRLPSFAPSSDATGLFTGTTTPHPQVSYVRFVGGGSGVVFPVFSFLSLVAGADQGDAHDENETLTRPGYEGARSRSRERTGGTGGVEQRKVGVTLTARGGTDYTGGRRQRGLSLQTSERWRVDFSVSSSSRAVSRSSSRSTDNIPSLVAPRSFDLGVSSCSLSNQMKAPRRSFHLVMVWPSGTPIPLSSATGRGVK